METRIHKTLMQWFPDAFAEIKNQTACSDYEILYAFAKFTLVLLSGDHEKKEEPFKFILLLYLKGTLYEKNAIENEYLSIIAQQERSMTLKEHLSLMPVDLRPIYIKTILEN